MSSITTNLTLQDLKDAAIQYRQEFVHIPFYGLSAMFPFVSLRLGVRYKERVGKTSTNAQFSPSKARKKGNLNINFRTLETFPSFITLDFDPNEAIQTIIGHRAAQAGGDALATTPTAKEMLGLIAKNAGEELFLHLFDSEYDADGETTKEAFNGWDTVAATEIKAGNISADKGNYLKLTEEITADNAYDVFTDILAKLSPKLRAQQAYVFCSQEIVDAYNKSYMLTHGGISYNSKFEQDYVEGSNKRLQFVPLPSKAGSKFIQIATKEEMLIGCDQMSDQERVDVNKYEPRTLTYEMDSFWGTDYETLDPSQFFLVELPGE